MSDIPEEKVYRLGQKITLYLEDCLAGMRKHLQAGEVDVVVTSPPRDERMPRDEYLDWLGEVGAEIKRVLKEDGSFFLIIGGNPGDPWMPFDAAQRLRKHFVLQNVIHLIKSIAIEKSAAGKYPGISGDVVVGCCNPIQGKRFLPDNHEYIFHFTKTGRVELDRLAVGVPYQDKSNIGRWKGAKQDRRCRGNTWFIPCGITFPIELPEMCIKLHGVKKTRLVLDPFMGIGATAAACLKLDVNAVGFEVDEKLMKKAMESLQVLQNNS